MPELTDTYYIVVSDDTPTLPIGWENYALWLEPDTGQWHKYNGGWQAISSPLMSIPSQIGDVNFTGTISVDGEEGLTGERTIDGHVLTFTKGILTGYQAP